MIRRIKKMDTLKDYMLLVTFDDGRTFLYDVKEDIHTLPGYNVLLSDGLFRRAQLDESRTCVSWTPDIDLPSDAIYDYGTPVVHGLLENDYEGRLRASRKLPSSKKHRTNETDEATCVAWRCGYIRKK